MGPRKDWIIIRVVDPVGCVGTFWVWWFVQNPATNGKRQMRDTKVKVWTIVGAKGDSRQARLSEEIIKPCREEEERVHVRRDFGLLFQGRSSLQRRLTWGVRESLMERRRWRKCSGSRATGQMRKCARALVLEVTAQLLMLGRWHRRWCWCCYSGSGSGNGAGCICETRWATGLGRQ